MVWCCINCTSNINMQMHVQGRSVYSYSTLLYTSTCMYRYVELLLPSIHTYIKDRAGQHCYYRPTSTYIYYSPGRCISYYTTITILLYGTTPYGTTKPWLNSSSSSSSSSRCSRSHGSRSNWRQDPALPYLTLPYLTLPFPPSCLIPCSAPQCPSATTETLLI